ncbi:hypothetical protein IZ6_10660 [Terrihabitans soli]|uniref:Uncharacterized protein n=1 Tax=Terrihabitans soli TaxID=708113 RepID=A0A6S6QTC9_9HYPH|nr:hypothetical protein [Terrihabitans soli]BCJ90331.1 hypothetical protein IZ6_10660 [Terrihabitans soli]
MERARDALREGLDRAAPEYVTDMPSPFDPRTAKNWDIDPASVTAPELTAHLFQPSTDILSVTADGEWLPGSITPKTGQTGASASADPETVEPPSSLPVSPTPVEKPRPERKPGKAHSVLRSGRASLVDKPAKNTDAPARRNPDRAAAKPPALTLPGELRP